MKLFHFHFKIKYIITLLLLLCLSFSISAQESERLNKIYENNKDAVFYVSRSVLIDESKIKRIELFKKLEQAMDAKILNQYIPIVSGSAFLINSEGYFITAAHVLQYQSRDDAIESAKFIFQEYIAEKCIPGYLTQRDIHFLFKDFVKSIKDSKFLITMKSVDQVDYIAEVIDENQTDDLALLKINLDKNISPVIFNTGNKINVGYEVLTIGYPLQSIMNTFLNDFKPTLTEGVISAIRKDKWDLQHTASINSGNSGGPLFGEEGQLIGINLGTVTNANDIYFSTNTQKIKDWLAEIKMAELITSEEVK